MPNIDVWNFEILTSVSSMIGFPSFSKAAGWHTLATNHITFQYVDAAFARRPGPYFHNHNGRGIASIKPTKAIKLLPHPYPSALYILGANKGNKKAIKLLENCIAAMALLV